MRLRLPFYIRLPKIRILLRRIAWATVLAPLLCGIIIVSIFAYSSAMIFLRFDGTATLPADCVVVFGAAVYSRSRPGPAIVRRVAAAADLYRNGHVNRLILTGGKGSGDRASEAAVMRLQATEQGVDPSVITLEEEAHSTWENLAFSRPLTADCISVVALSDQYHLARIELIAGRQGWDDLKTVPAQDRPPAISEQRSVIREIFAYVYYLLHLDQFLSHNLTYKLYQIIPGQSLQP